MFKSASTARFLLFLAVSLPLAAGLGGSHASLKTLDAPVNDREAAIPSIVVSTPRTGDTVPPGDVVITGAAGKPYRNVAAFDLDHNMKKVAMDVAPSNGEFTLTISARSLGSRTAHIAVMAFSTPPGQSGGVVAEVDLTLNVSAAVRPTPKPRQISAVLDVD